MYAFEAASGDQTSFIFSLLELLNSEVLLFFYFLFFVLCFEVCVQGGRERERERGSGGVLMGLLYKRGLCVRHQQLH